MNNNINVKICKCGTIHVMYPEKVRQAMDMDANYLEVCRNCGATSVIGTFSNGLDEDGSEMCTFYDVELPDDRCSFTYDDFDFTCTNDKKLFSEIYFSRGYKVPMKSGGYATYFKDNSFYDTTYPATAVYKDGELAIKDVKNQCVDMNILIEETPKEILYAFSKLRISGIDWTGTKYDNRYNLVPNDVPYIAPYELREFRLDITPEMYSDIVNYRF